MNTRLIALAVALVALVTVPFWMPGSYYINVTSQILFYAIFALGLNVLAGYGGLVSLGHAGLLGIVAYAVAYTLQAGFGHAVAIMVALVIGLISMAIYAVVSLRATGIGFIMITLALGEIIWGLAYRWISITNGDNGISVHTRPAPFDLSLKSPIHFYYMTLVVFLLSIGAMTAFVRSPLGAALMGTRDQPRRMNALGYHVWAIRFWACMLSGLLTAVAGILFVYYNEFISPQALDLTASAEVLLMVIAGGAGTLLGPVVGAALVVIVKSVVSAYVTRWNMLLGAIFVVIVVFMPEGIVPGSARLWRAARRHLFASAPNPAAKVEAELMSALTVSRLSKSFGGLHVTRDVNLNVAQGERRLIIGPNGAGKTTLFNQITGEIAPDTGTVKLFGKDVTRMPSRRRPHLGMARTYQIITLFPENTIVHNVSLALLGLSQLRWNPLVLLKRQSHIVDEAHEALKRVGLGDIAERPLGQTSYGERRRVEIAMALAQKPKVLLLDEPFAGLSIDERRDVHRLLMEIPRDVTMVMIEHNMDVALEFAERITLLHFGEVIVEGTRAEVVADPRTREVYLGH